MKNLLIPVFILFVGIVNGQVVPLDSVGNHVGALTTVCDSVWSTFVSKSGTVYLNFGGSFPKNTFSAVIFSKDTSKFQEYRPVEFLKHKKVCITGMIDIYKGKPQIIVKGPNQVRAEDEN